MVWESCRAPNESMGAPRGGPGEEHVFQPPALRRRRAAVQMRLAERRQHQQVPMPGSLCSRQRLCGGIEVLCGPLAQAVEVALQMRGRRVLCPVVVVDACGQKL